MARILHLIEFIREDFSSKGDFGTYMLYQFYLMAESRPTKVGKLFSRIRNLMTIGKSGLDLQSYLLTLGINEFSNFVDLNDFEKFEDESTKECLDQMIKKANEEKQKLQVDSVQEFYDNTQISQPSPCWTLEEYPKCATYCQWHLNFSRSFSRKLVNTMMR